MADQQDDRVGVTYDDRARMDEFPSHVSVHGDREKLATLTPDPYEVASHLRKRITYLFERSAVARPETGVHRVWLTNLTRMENQVFKNVIAPRTRIEEISSLHKRFLLAVYFLVVMHPPPLLPCAFS